MSTVSEIPPYLWILCKSFMCSHERAGWLRSRDLGKRAGNFSIKKHFSSDTGMNAGWILRMNSAPSCFTCCIFHIMSIPFHKSDTAIRVAKAIICAEVITLCFAMFALFLEFRDTTRLRPFLISETGLKFLIFQPGQRGSCEGSHDLYTNILEPGTGLIFRYKETAFLQESSYTHTRPRQK